MCYAKWPVTEPHVSWLMSLETYTHRSAYHLPRCNSVCNSASPKRNTTVTSAAKTVGEKRSLGHARYRLDAGCWDSHPRGRDPLFINTLGLMVFLPWTKTKTTTLSFLELHLFTQLACRLSSVNCTALVMIWRWQVFGVVSRMKAKRSTRSEFVWKCKTALKTWNEWW
jgi:hypothetical protein